MDAAGLDPDQHLQLGNDRPQSVAVKGIAVQRLGVQHELPAFRLGGRGCHGHLAAELVRRPGLAFADAFNLGGVQRIHFRTALPVILETHPHRQGEQVREAFLERLIASDFAPNIADHAASRIRRNLSSRRARLNWCAWV
jgi:hypothetical protein